MFVVLNAIRTIIINVLTIKIIVKIAVLWLYKSLLWLYYVFYVSMCELRIYLYDCVGGGADTLTESVNNLYMRIPEAIGRQ